MIRLRNIEKSFSHGPAKTFVLRRIDLEIQNGRRQVNAVAHFGDA